MFLQLFFFLQHSAVGASDLQKSTRVIKIEPFDLTSNTTLQASDVAVKRGNEHGVGHLFNSCHHDTGGSHCFSPPGMNEPAQEVLRQKLSENKDFMSKLVAYQNAHFTGKNANRNTLLVKLQLQQGSTDVATIYFGLFISGNESYLVGDSTDIDDKKVKYDRALKEYQRTRREFKMTVQSLLGVVVDDGTDDQFEPVLSKRRLEDGRMYKTQLFTVNDKVLPVLSLANICPDDPGVEAVGKKIEDLCRVANEENIALLTSLARTGRDQTKVKTFLEAIKNVKSSYDVLGPRMPYFFDTISKKIGSNSQALFGRESFFSSAADKGFEHAFCDSEQAWLLSIESYNQSAEDLGLLNKPAALESGIIVDPLPAVSKTVDHIEVSLFSYRDVCKFCRGTISLLLSPQSNASGGNSWMQKQLSDFVNKVRKQKKLLIDPVDSKINVSIFGYSFLENSIEKR